MSCMYMYVHMCMYVCMYVYIHVYTYTSYMTYYYYMYYMYIHEGQDYVYGNRWRKWRLIPPLQRPGTSEFTTPPVTCNPDLHMYMYVCMYVPYRYICATCHVCMCTCI